MPACVTKTTNRPQLIYAVDGGFGRFMHVGYKRKFVYGDGNDDDESSGYGFKC